MAFEEPKTSRLNLKRWRRSMYWVLVGLVAVELPLIVAFLTLVGISDPDLYRTKLWEDGYLNGFNSSPDQPLYAAANHLIPVVPLVWSQSITTFNLVSSIFVTFVLISKIIFVPFHILWPVVSFLVHGLEAGLFAYSIYGQTSPDTIDPDHQNTGLPWYISKNCGVAVKASNRGYCQQAKAVFYLTIFLLALYSVQIFIALQSLFFAPQEGETDQETTFWASRFPKLAEAETTYEPSYTPRIPYPAYTPPWEMKHYPNSPGTMGGMTSPFYAPHAGYATAEAAMERERGSNIFDMAPKQQLEHATSLSPGTPRTKALYALDGGIVQDQQLNLKAEWGRREMGNLPWSGRNSGGSNACS